MLAHLRTVELSDWSMSERQQRKAAQQLTAFPFCRLGTDVFSSSASQRIPVTAIRADYEFAKAFYTPTPPRPRLGILRRLEPRKSGRRFFPSRCAQRNGTRT